MLVDNNVYKNTYMGNGATTEFPISFPFLDGAHIQVLQSLDNGVTESVVSTSEYSISGAGLEVGGTCTFKTAPQNGAIIVILRNVPITQLYAYRELDNFPAESHENALAKLTMIDQQQQEQINRALKVSGASQQTAEELMEELFQVREESKEAQKAAESAQSAAESCRDEACACAAEAAATLESAVTVIQQQEQQSVEVVQSEGDTQVQRLEDIAKTIIISATAYNKTVSVQLTSPITNGDTYTLPESLVYLVGKSQLFISANGAWLYNNYQYEELGTEGIASSQVRFLQDFSIDDVITFTILANTVNLLTSTNSGLVNDSNGCLKVNIDGQTVLINTNGQIYVPVMTGATESGAGTSGLVPAPSAGDQDKVLKGDGTWAYLSGMPIGTIFWMASDKPVDCAIVCNGATPLIATYPDLYAVIGTRYGGDGVTTFGVPNMIGRVAWGATTPGTYLAAGLPNITGYNPIAWSLEHSGIVNNAGGATGALAAAKQTVSGITGGTSSRGTATTQRGVAIDASLSSPIYGKSTTVQPPALTLVPYIKAYDTVQNVGSMDAAQLASEINRLDGKFGDYLPTSGGTMEGGSIKLNANTRIGTIFYYDSDGFREVGIEANIENGDGNGAALVLRPSNSSLLAGGFSLGARTNRNNEKWLSGDVSGTLIWNGKHIARSVNGNNADNAGNVHLPVFIANQSAQIYLPAGGTWNVLYFSWGTDNGWPGVTTLPGGSAIPKELSYTVVFAIRRS